MQGDFLLGEEWKYILVDLRGLSHVGCSKLFSGRRELVVRGLYSNVLVAREEQDQEELLMFPLQRERRDI